MPEMVAQMQNTTTSPLKGHRTTPSPLPRASRWNPATVDRWDLEDDDGDDLGGLGQRVEEDGGRETSLEKEDAQRCT